MFWDSDLDRASAAYIFASSPAQTMRVLAGPGTGKSFGLQRRVARLLEEGTPPSKILAVTFTRTAARDLRNAINDIGIEGSENVVTKTLHSLCFGLLGKREIMIRTGRTPRPLLDYEQKVLLHDLSNEFGNIKAKGLRLKSFEAAWARLQSDEPGFPLDEIDRKFSTDITEWLIAHKAMLIGEMIIEAYHYLSTNPHCLERRQFSHILVDEYQDLNKAEQKVIDMLSTTSSIAIIGDDDQSIYSFKHANPEGIRCYHDTHPGCQDISFNCCRRCPKRVVMMASKLISHNRNRTLGDLCTYQNNRNGNVYIVQWATLDEEIHGLSLKVAGDISQGSVAPEDVLILTPKQKIGIKIRDALVNEGINAKSYFRETAIDTDELRYNFSLLNLLANPEDLVSLRFLLGFGSSNYRTSQYKIVREYAAANELSIKETLDMLANGSIRLANTNSIKAKYIETLTEINGRKTALNDDRTQLIDIFTSDNPEYHDFRDILNDAISELGYQEDKNLKHWLHNIYSYVFERISFPENTENPDHVRIMSLHASKGLSSKYVIVMSAIDELLPRIDRTLPMPVWDQIEEQRRLFYVAITRCKSCRDGHEGTLIISSFAGLSGADALSLNISASPYRYRNVSSTRFITEFERTAPATLNRL